MVETLEACLVIFTISIFSYIIFGLIIGEDKFDDDVFYWIKPLFKPKPKPKPLQYCKINLYIEKDYNSGKEWVLVNTKFLDPQSKIQQEYILPKNAKIKITYGL